MDDIKERLRIAAETETGYRLYKFALAAIESRDATIADKDEQYCKSIGRQAQTIAEQAAELARYKSFHDINTKLIAEQAAELGERNREVMRLHELETAARKEIAEQAERIKELETALAEGSLAFRNYITASLECDRLRVENAEQVARIHEQDLDTARLESIRLGLANENATLRARIKELESCPEGDE